MAKKQTKKINKNTGYDLQTKLTLLLATVVLVINCYTISDAFVKAKFNTYTVEATEE